MKIRDIIPVAKGDVEATTIYKNARIFNVFTGQLEQGNIAVFRKRIAGIGDYSQAKNVIDAQGMIALPGFIDAHLHIESSMLTPKQFAKAVLMRGTTTVVADPHEIGNVLGTAGIDYVIKATEGIPLNVYVGIPSAVPTTNLETAGASLASDDMLDIVDRYPSRVIALGEVMNYPGVLACDRELITKIEILRHRYKKIDGHAPGLTGKQLNAYLCAFIRSDHECSNREEALEKVARGMQIFIREGSAARDLDELIHAVTPFNHHFFSFCTDDRDPHAILSEGHIDCLVRRAIAAGIDPAIAIRMATINTARYYNLRSMGAIAPGYKADLLFVDDLTALNIRMVVKDGAIVVKDGEILDPMEGLYHDLPAVMGRLTLPALETENLHIPHQLGKNLRVMQVSQGSLLTKEVHMAPCVQNGLAVADATRDLAKVLVVNRHTGKSYSLGFVKGLGIRTGAIGTSVGHDSHNICIAGMNDADMMIALREIEKHNGGMVVVKEGKVLSALPLPLAGLMSDKELFDVVAHIKHIRTGLKELGTEHEVFMNLSFIQLAVIPALKITDKGLVDVSTQSFVDLWTNA